MPEAMRIAYITNQYGRASDTFIRQEVRQLRRRGHEVFTFSTRRPDASHEVSEEIRQEQGATEYIVEQGLIRLLGAVVWAALWRPLGLMSAVGLAWRMRGVGLRPLVMQVAYLLEAAYLARRLVAHRIELIHNHIPMNSATVCALGARLAGIPFSMTVHGPHEFYEPARWALAKKIEESAFTVCICEHGRSQCMVLSPRWAWGKLRVIRCGLDERFLDAAATPVPEAPRLVCVGRLCQEKGQMLLVDAVAELRRRGVGVEVVVIGDGPDRGAIEEAARRQGVTEAVRVVGWRSTEEVRAEIQRSRALVLPSFAEGLPIVIMEALAMHRPVIGTHVAGIPELVEPGRIGWLVPAGAVGALAEAMREAVTASAASLAQMGRIGAARVAVQHDAALEAGRLEALMQGVVIPRRGGALTAQPMVMPVQQEI